MQCPIDLQKWKISLGNLINTEKLKNQSKVCELHFNDEDLLKYDEVKLKDGTTFRSMRNHITHHKGAVPLKNPKKYTIIVENEVYNFKYDLLLALIA